MSGWLAALRFQPVVPASLLLALAALAGLVCLVALLGRARGVWLRLAAFTVGLLYLAGPQRVIRTGTVLPRIAVLAVDQSASMRVGNRARLAEAAAARIAHQAAQMPGLQVRRVTFSNDGAGTTLFAALARALADIPPAQRAGVIAITDGAIADVPPHFPLPLNALITARGEQTDRRLRVLDAPGYGIVGQSVSIRFVVDDLGAAGSRPAHVVATRNGQILARITVRTGQAARITVPIDHAGPSVLALSVDKLPGEASTLNNRVAIAINGVRDRLRVLLISGEPNQGERTWRRLLKSDPSVDLVHFTILRPPGKDDFTPLDQLALIAFPIRELFVEKIKQFDLIILDRFSESGLLPPSYVDNIVSYVRNGGALLVSAGPEFAETSSVAQGPIGDILPALPLPHDAVVDGAFRPVVTRLGKRDPVTENLPGASADGPPHWGQWYRRIAVGPVHGDVLMNAGASGKPLLILNRVDKGRVALLLSDQIWLWARGHDGGGPQAELLRRVAHWLMKQPELDENALVAQVTNGRVAVERHGIDKLPPNARLSVTDPDGKTTEIPWKITPDGREMAGFAAPVPGLWRLRAGRLTTYVAVPPSDPVEFADLRATARRLRPVARGVHWLDPEGAPSLDALALIRGRALALTGLSTAPLLPAYVALPLLLLLLLGAWRREGR